MNLRHSYFNPLRPRQHGRHFPDAIFRCIFLNENIWVAINISLSVVPKGPIDNIPALVQIMAWRRSGDKPLSQPMMVSLLTHICVTRSQWVNTLRPGSAYKRPRTGSDWLRLWLGTEQAPSHHLKPGWRFVNWALRNQLLWNVTKNSNSFYSRNASEKVVCKKATICTVFTLLKVNPVVRQDIPGRLVLVPMSPWGPGLYFTNCVWAH